MVGILPTMSFAAVPKEEQGLAFALDPTEVDIAEDFNEFKDLTKDMLDVSKLFKLKDGKDLKQKVDLTDTFQTGRLIVRPDSPLPADVLKTAQKAISYLDYVILQFSSKKAAQNAYEALKDLYGSGRVIPDVIFKANINEVKALQPIDMREKPTTGPYLSWGVRNMGMDKVKAKLAKRSNKPTVRVAVLDTGISMLDSIYESGRIANQFDAVLFSGLPMDFNGHGTFCAGVIAESTPSNVKIVPVKVMNATGFGSTLSIIIGCFYAAEIKADVVSMSLGGEVVEGINYLDEFFKDIRNNKGCIVVASGNEARDVKYSYPANSKYVITVSGLKQNNRVDRRYSNYGSQVDFAAPGTDVGGTYAVLGIPMYQEASGTSMAAPHVAAACALIKTAHPSYNQTQVYNVLKAYSVDIEAKGKDIRAGWGRIDLSGYANRI